MTVQCAIYARVSSEGQKDNSSLDAQTRRGREHAASQGWTIVTEARETFSGGDEMVLGRPEFWRLLELGEKGQISKIVVDIPDRLGRGQAIPKCETLAELNHCSIAYADDPFGAFLGDDDGNDEIGKAVMRLMGEQAKVTTSGVERLLITRRLTGGKRAWAKQGRIIACGVRPYGYHFQCEYDDRGHKTACCLEVDEEEAEIVRQVYIWCAYEDWSPYAIARELTKRGIVTPSGKDPRHGNELGCTKWSRNTTYRMLRNSTYRGEWAYGKTRNKRKAVRPGKIHTKVTRRATDDPKRITVSCPAIVDTDLWVKAQKRLDARSQADGGRPSKKPHLLKGLITCMHCGSVLTLGSTSGSRKDKRRYRYYNCRRNHILFDPDRCPGRPLRVDIAADVVWGYVCEALQDTEAIKAKLEEQKAAAEKANKAIEMTIAGLDAQTAKDQERLNRLLDLYTDGDLGKEQYKAKTAKIKATIQQREKERADLEARRKAASAPTEDDELELEQLRAMTAQGLESATFEEKRRILALLDVRCIWNDETRELSLTGILHGAKLGIISRFERRGTSRSSFHGAMRSSKTSPSRQHTGGKGLEAP